MVNNPVPIHHIKPITESHIEQSVMETLQAQGWAYVNHKANEPNNPVFSLHLSSPGATTKQP